MPVNLGIPVFISNMLYDWRIHLLQRIPLIINNLCFIYCLQSKR